MTWDELQDHAANAVIDAIARDVRRIVLTGPTGCGKTRMALKLIDRYPNTVFYTNRKLLIEQLGRVFAKDGRSFGVRAAGHEDQRERPLQISSIPTENARTLKADSLLGGWKLHGAALAILDEAHLHTGPVAQEIMRRHYEDGAAIVGLTATPLDLGGLYDEMIVAGTTSQFRKAGALVPALHYGPDEPDMESFGKATKAKLESGDDLTEKEISKAIMTHGIFGRVLEWFHQLNPEQKPTILFAPGVKESVWFAEQFVKEGIKAAHIDGENVWVNGQVFKSSRSAREDVLAASEHGDIKVLSNRFVLREGVDAPWLQHGIFATIFGSLQAYLQSGGRLLRSHPGKKQVTVADHGGNWHRNGSLNADRDWTLEGTARIVSGLRRERLRSGQEKEPMRCPQCGLILARTRCPCGFEIQGSSRSRPVIQSDGTIKQMVGDIYAPRRLTKKSNASELWKRMYYRARSEKWNATFLQAEAMFAQENHWGYPPRDLPLMPKNLIDFFMRVKDVPPERLR